LRSADSARSGSDNGKHSLVPFLSLFHPTHTLPDLYVQSPGRRKFKVGVLPVLVAFLPDLVTSTSPRRDDMREKHSLGAIPQKWEYQTRPSASTTMDLRIALRLRPRTLSLTSSMTSVTPSIRSMSPCFCVFICIYSHYTYPATKIRCAHVQETSYRSRRVASATLELVSSWLAHHRIPLAPGIYPPWYNIPILPPHRDEQDYRSYGQLSYGQLRVACYLARVRADSRTDDIFQFTARCPPANLEIGIELPDVS